MFEKRLRIVLIVFAASWLLVSLRLFQLQVVQAEYYQQRAQQRLIKSVKTLEPMRGRIVDRHGSVIASDEPVWSIAMHYRLLALDTTYHEQLAADLLDDEGSLQRHARQMIRAQGVDPPRRTDDGLVADLMAHLRRNVDAEWVAGEINDFLNYLVELLPKQTMDQLNARAEELTSEVHRWKAAYLRKHHIEPQDAPAGGRTAAEGGMIPLRGRRRHRIAEEMRCHPVVEGLRYDQRIELQKLLRQRYGWLFELGAVEIADSSRRVYHDAECLAHVSGQLREVTREGIDARPYRQDGKVIDRGGYRGRDLIGESGVERMCEDRLRGRRGSLTVYRDERPPRRIEPNPGIDVELTIDHSLQREVYDLLADRVAEFADVPGGSVVVLDIPTRQVLAMASYPAFDPNEYRRRYAQLSRDVRSFPLHFRAVYRQYEPGSIIKPLTVLAAHGAGLINEQTTYQCRGRLDPNVNKFRCWVPSGSTHSIQHGSITSEQAIKGSCNVFCYNLGDLFRERSGNAHTGVQLMCEWLDLFGIGRPTGIGLAEEKRGILPWPSYLRSVKRRSPNVSDPRNYSIGQGEMQVTPLQAANLAAIYASGVSRPISLLKGLDERPAMELPVADSVWRLIRRGMYQVVNEIGGTARLFARMDHPRYVLCGKSGSAETNRWATQFRIDYQDGEQRRSVIVPANNASVAGREFARLYPELAEEAVDISPATYWPTHAAKDRKHSHAWFIAFIQPKRSNGRPDWTRQSRIAIAVLLEFGGSGGRSSGPLCRNVAELIIDRFPQYVDPQAPLAMEMD